MNVKNNIILFLQLFQMLWDCFPMHKIVHSQSQGVFGKWLCCEIFVWMVVRSDWCDKKFENVL
jgi:hypothetical protein